MDVFRNFERLMIFLDKFRNNWMLFRHYAGMAASDRAITASSPDPPAKKCQVAMPTTSVGARPRMI